MHQAEMRPDIERLQACLGEWFAPWIQALNLRVTALEDHAVSLRLPITPQLTRVGDILCGQAMMAAADTAMVLAICRELGTTQQPMTTVQLNTSFLRPLSAQDAVVRAEVLRAGKSLVFGEITLHGATDGKCVCKASTTYALL